MEKVELTKKLDRVVEVARKNYNEDGMVVTCFFLFTKKEDGETSTGIIPLIDGMVDDRFKILSILGKSLADGKVAKEITGIAMVSEAWVSTRPIEDEQDILSGKIKMRPSEDPQRKEVVVVAGMTSAGDTEVRYVPIESKEGKKSLSTKEEKTGDESHAHIFQPFWSGYFGLKTPS